MKYTKQQIEHVLARFDEAVHEHIESILGNNQSIDETLTITIPVKVTSRVTVRNYRYVSNYNETHRFDYDWHSGAMKDALEKAMKAKKSPIFKEMAAAGTKAQKVVQLADKSRKNLVDTLILGDSDALSLLHKAIEELRAIK